VSGCSIRRRTQARPDSLTTLTYERRISVRDQTIAIPSPSPMSRRAARTRSAIGFGLKLSRAAQTFSASRAK
jgi:hypothetical protein